MVDVPYGILPNVEWDKIGWAREDFEQLYRSVQEINECENQVWAVWCSFQQVGCKLRSFVV